MKQVLLFGQNDIPGQLNYGVGLYSQVFDVFSQSLITELKKTINETLKKQIKEIADIQTIITMPESSELHINIKYRIIKINEIDYTNLVVNKDRQEVLHGI